MKKRSQHAAETSPAPPSVELLNIWIDFRKVVKFIDDNQGWLTPCLKRITGKEP